MKWKLKTTMKCHPIFTRVAKIKTTDIAKCDTDVEKLVHAGDTVSVKVHVCLSPSNFTPRSVSKRQDLYEDVP